MVSFFVIYFHEDEGEADDDEDEEKIEIPHPVSDVHDRQRVKSNPYAMWPCALFLKKDIPLDIHEYDEENADCIAEHVP